MLADLVDGWSAFTSMTWVWVVVVAFGFLNAIQAGAWTPRTGRRGRHDRHRRWGWVLSAMAAGLLAMTVVHDEVAAHLSGPRRHDRDVAARRPILCSGSTAGCSRCGVRFIAGCGIEVFAIGWQTAFHEHVPNELLSRVTSYDALGSFVAIPVGTLAFGPLAAAFGVREVVVVCRDRLCRHRALTLLSRSVRDLQRADGPEQPVAGRDTLERGVDAGGSVAT